MDPGQQRLRALKADTYALYLAARDPRTPWYAKLLAACVVAYALSPLDVIPDFVPVLGLLDDLVLVPLGIALVLRLVPHAVMADCREQARTALAAGTLSSRKGTFAIIAVWILLAGLAVLVIGRASLDLLAWRP